MMEDGATTGQEKVDPTELADDDPAKLPGEFKHVAIEEIRPNAWNPQEMDDKEFNALAESMAEGMIDPIQIVPLAEGDPKGAKYVILGGEHRWEVAKTLGWENIPCIVLTDERFADEDLQKFITLRMNVIRGKINPEKFRDMYEEMVERYDHEALQQLMGFADSDQFDKLVGGVKDALKATGLPPEALQEFAEVVEEMKTVDDLSNILNRLFTKYGDTLKNHFMVFAFGGKEHLFIKCDKALWKKVKDLSAQTLEERISITSVLNDMFDGLKLINLKKYDRVTSEEPESFASEAPPK